MSKSKSKTGNWYVDAPFFAYTFTLIYAFLLVGVPILTLCGIDVYPK